MQCERNVDYVVCNKALVETLFDLEFKEPTDKAFFYSGNAQILCRMLLPAQAAKLTRGRGKRQCEIL